MGSLAHSFENQTTDSRRIMIEPQSPRMKALEVWMVARTHDTEVCSTDGCGLPHLTTGSALSMTSYEALWVPWWYGLRVRDPSSEKIFSIHSVLKVASQHWIFASGVYRKFPAPDFNRLASLLPRRTARSCNQTFVARQDAIPLIPAYGFLPKA
jgi:hypothetical protein